MRFYWGDGIVPGEMTVWPVIERELRAEARRAGAAWVRPIAAGAGLVVAAWMLLGGTRGLRPGPELFNELHHVLFLTIWLMVPLMTADCVSREKREQTLGLLFLTPLRAGEILLAKVLAQGLRAATAVGAVGPVLLLPLLMGGVAWETVVTALFACAGAFLWALAAGVLASVLSRSVLGALGWALILALLFLVGHSMLAGLAVHGAVSGLNRLPPSLEWLSGLGLLVLWTPEQAIDSILRIVPAAVRPRWVVASSLVVPASALGLAVVAGAGAWLMRRTWRESPPSPRRARLTGAVVRPRLAPGLFRASMRRSMERNPVGWLERRRWTSRAAFWGWLGLLALAYAATLASFERLSELREMQTILGAALIFLVALVSSASLRRERESGVLELLLTTPLTPRQIVEGRLRGIWRQFLPALLLFGVVSFEVDRQFDHGWSRRGALIEILVALAMMTVAVPVAGLWFSLRARQFVHGLVWTIGLMAVVPWAAAVAVDYLAGILGSGLLVAVAGFGVWGALQLRAGLHWIGAGLLAAGLLVALTNASYLSGRGLILLNGRPLDRPVRAHGFALSCLVLGLGGVAHRGLLRDLGPATAARGGVGRGRLGWIMGG